MLEIKKLSHNCIFFKFNCINFKCNKENRTDHTDIFFKKEQ